MKTVEMPNVVIKNYQYKNYIKNLRLTFPAAIKDNAN